jgi:hypothetical protein
LPPDVRRWLCPADSSQSTSGAMPLAIRIHLVKGRTKGIAQI